MNSRNLNKSLLIAGTHSGSGKTIVSLGLMAALKKQGLVVQPFKCGPDFIDPSLHQSVTGRISRNLDPWMCGPDFVRQTFNKHGKAADINIIEGVMGMFDGGESSSAALAQMLDVPIVLVLDVRSAAESMAAVLKGFETLEPKVAPRAVILNRVGSHRHLNLISQAIQKYCRTEIIGYLPRELNFSIPKRHLGLYMGGEHPMGENELELLAATITEHVDLERVLTRNKTENRESGHNRQERQTTRVRIGIARDHAFCFYYEDNLDLFRKAGAELVFFSPLNDTRLPDRLQGIYLGGGYPELYMEKLSANKSMRAAIKNWAEAGKVIYAECGGFMYLCEGMRDFNETFFPMCGVFPWQTKMNSSRTALGYREVYLQGSGFFGPAGTRLRGHEFHYSQIDDMDHLVEHFYETDGAEEAATGYRYKNVLAGYVHLHFGYTPHAAQAFINTCREKP